MKKEIVRISLVLLVFLAGASYADEPIIPKDVNEALELEYKEQLKNAEKFKDAVSEVLNNPIEIIEGIEAKSKNIEYVCVRTTGGTWLERNGVHCQRCAWYSRIGNCTFKPGDQCISERLTDFTYTCVYAPDTNAPQ